MIDTRIGPRGRWIRLVAAPVGALALVALAACGTDTSTTSTGTSSAAAQLIGAFGGGGARRGGAGPLAV